MGKRRVTVAKGDHRHVDETRLPHWLVIGPGVGDNQKTRFLELLGDLIGKSSRSVSASNVLCAGVLSKFQNRTLSVRSGADGNHILRVLDGNNHTSSHHQLVIGTAKVNDVYTVLQCCKKNEGHVRKGKTRAVTP